MKFQKYNNTNSSTSHNTVIERCNYKFNSIARVFASSPTKTGKRLLGFLAKYSVFSLKLKEEVISNLIANFL